MIQRYELCFYRQGNPMVPDDHGSIVKYSSYREEIEKKDKEIQYLKGLIHEALITMRHAEIFITSREKMHQDGQMLYRDCVENLEAEENKS